MDFSELAVSNICDMARSDLIFQKEKIVSYKKYPLDVSKAEIGDYLRRMW